MKEEIEMQFYETVMGKRFFESQLPELTKALNRMATAMEQNAVMQEPAPQPAKFESNRSYISEMYEAAKHSQIDLCLRPCTLTAEVQQQLQAVLADNKEAAKLSAAIERTLLDENEPFYNKGSSVAKALLANDSCELFMALTGLRIEDMLDIADKEVK